MKILFKSIGLVLWFVMSFSTSRVVSAAPPVSGPEDLPGITHEQIEAKIKEIEADQGIEQALKPKLLEIYRKAQSILQSAYIYSDAAKAFERARETAPEQTAEIRRQLEQRSAKPPTPESMGISQATLLPDLEQRLIKEQADLAALEAKLNQIEEKQRQENSRPNAARDRLTEAKRVQHEIAEQLRLPQPAGESHQVSEARGTLLEVRQRAMSAEVHMLDQELLSQSARIKLLAAQRDQTARNVSLVESHINLLEELINQRRREEAERVQAQMTEARLHAAGKHPLIQNLAERNAQLSKELAALTFALEGVTDRRESVEKRTKQIANDFESARQRIDIAGLSQTLAQLLHDRKWGWWSELKEYKKGAATREDMIEQAALKQFQHTEERRTLTDIHQTLTQLTAGLKTEDIPLQERELIQQEARKLLEARRELLDSARSMDATYLRELGELDFAIRQLIGTVQDFRDFLDEHLLWMPNVSPIGSSTLSKLPEGVFVLLFPSNWIQVVEVLIFDNLWTPMIIILTVVLVAILLLKKRGIKRFLDDIAHKVGSLSEDRISYTFQALGATLLLVTPWPLLMAVLGWQLQLSQDAAFAIAVGEGLSFTAGSLFNLLAFRALCRPGGVTQIHLKWSSQVLNGLRRPLDWLIVVIVPAAFVAVVSSEYQQGAYIDSVSRISYFVLMMALAWFFARILNPKGDTLKSVLSQHPSGWLAKFRHLWLLLTVLIPLALISLAAAGYYYTAYILTERLIETLWLILGIVIAKDLVLRWLVLTRQRIALKVALEKSKATEATRLITQSGQLDGEAAQANVKDEEIDFVTIDTQTRTLLNTMLVLTAAVVFWLIWSEVLPALGILDKMPLWNTSVFVDGEQKLSPITVADLALAVLLVIITVVAAKNLPGVIELAFLQRLSLESASRYTITTLAQYAIVAIGIVLIFQTIGGSWSQIQWLVAALGVGLGFGLQEIFGNFISGLIILFERPIRVGDTVTVGDITGVVSKIRIRATTITNWDQQELLVPNKEFITSRLLNWTLSDQVNRIVITVGVAYGSDVKKALHLMAEAAEEDEHVLADPKPILTFEGFGDNALTLLLRCYLNSLEFRLSTISALHESINRKFEEAGIAIAFPQRDVHVDTTKPLEVRVQRERPSVKSANDTGDDGDTSSPILE